jgi:hypothetical protein
MMMNRLFKIATLAGALMVAAGSMAMASTSQDSSPGRLVPVTQEIKDWFATRGVNAAYVAADKASVPAGEWNKIVGIVNTPDVTDDTTDTHDALNALVDQALVNASSTLDEPVYMDIGGTRWVFQLDSEDD